MATVYIAPASVYQRWNNVVSAYQVDADGQEFAADNRTDLAAKIRATIVLDRDRVAPAVSPQTFYRYDVGAGAQLWEARWSNVRAFYLVASEQPRKGDRFNIESDEFSLPEGLARA